MVMSDEAAYLRAGIKAYLDGDHPKPKRSGRCEHWVWDPTPCEQCVDAHFRAVLEGTWKPMK